MRSFKHATRGIGLLLLCIFAIPARAELPVLAIDAVFPPVLSTNHPNALKVTGGRFTQDIEQIVFSDPRIVAKLDESASLPLDPLATAQKVYGSFSVTVDPSVPPGIYELWATGRYGVSNSRFIAVVNTPVENLPPSIDPKNPPEVLPGVCYVGLTKRNDRVLLRTKKAERWPRILLASQSIDATTLAALQVSDSEGNVLSQLRSVNREPIVFTTPTSVPTKQIEELRLGIHDFLYRSSESMSFALVIDPPDNHPLLSANSWKSPFSVFASAVSEWPSVDANAQPSALQDGSSPQAILPQMVPSPPWQVKFRLSAKEPTREIEFTPSEGAAYECEVLSETMGQLSDIRVIADRVVPPPTPEQLLEIRNVLAQNPSGVVADNPGLQQRIQDFLARGRFTGRDVISIAEDGSAVGTRAVRLVTTDPIFSIPPGPANKNIRLSVSDLNLQPSSKHSTEVVLRLGPPVPRVHAVGHWLPDTNNSAQAKTTGVSLPKGGQVAMHVSVRRAGNHSLPIELSCESLPAGVTVAPSVLAPGQSEGILVFFADENAVGSLGAIKPVAKTKLNPADPETVIPIQAAAIVVSASGDRGLPQARISGQWLLKVVDQDLAPIQIRAGDSPGLVLEIPQGGAGKLPVRAVRRAGGEAKGIMRPQNLPPKVTLGEFELPEKALEANPEIKVAADAPVGEYTVWFATEIVLKQSLHPESHSRLLAYRDRIQGFLADPNWAGDRPAAEKIIAETNPKLEALAKEIAPRDFQTFLPSAPFRLKVVPAAEPPK